MKVENVDNKVVMLGDNYFESGVITIPADTVIKAGTVLKRQGDGSFAPAVDGDELVAVNPFDLENENNAAQEVSFRALIAGRVRGDMLLLEGSLLISVKWDDLRKFGIIPRKVTDLSHKYNQ